MAARDKYPVTECDNCGADCTYMSAEAMQFQSEGRSFDELALSEDAYVAVHGGYCLDLTGHYGGFTDDLERSNLSRVILCHDCALAVARVLPGIFGKSGARHSMFFDEEHTSCCEFAWKFDKDESGKTTSLNGDGKGGWVPNEEN
jgi:hypothetical protein